MGNTIQLNEHIFYSEVENAFAVWFNTSRKFMLLEEPAFFVLKNLTENKSPESIALECCVRYQNPVNQCQQFVSEVHQITQQYINLKDDNSLEKYDLANLKDLKAEFCSEKYYSIGNLSFTINYGDIGLEDVIHPLISHFEVNKNNGQCHQFDIYRNSENLFFRVDGEIIEILHFDETGYLKAAVLLKLLGIIYDIRKDNWMMTLHAAAVTDGNSAIVFPAKAGSGKSTLAALLHAHGFNLLSDDFLAVDSLTKNIYHLPVATTIKEGSMEVLTPFYPELKDIPAEKAYTGKQVRYLTVSNSFTPNNGYLAKYFVFINYLPGCACTFNEVPKKTALKSLLEETWVNPVPANVTEFFDWFNQTVFYELKYSKTSDAIEVITRLFN